jgi:membrane protein implicated in regulation of membrane protease activity
MGFSFAGITFYNTLSNKTLLIAWALVVGLFFVWIFLFIIRQIQKLSEDNTFELTKTLYERAEVYLTIPENKKGKGKIIISIKGSVRELEAMTENESLPSGSLVKVVGIENNILIVESL